MTNSERAAKLLKIAEKINELLDEATELVTDTHEGPLALTYPIPGIRCCTTNDHGYLSRSTTLEDVANSLKESG